jgi:hypothetical protein
MHKRGVSCALVPVSQLAYRAYNADLGRWINRDPIQEDGGANLFAFTHGNPVNRVDTYGECPLILAILPFLGTSEALVTGTLVATTITGGALTIAGALEGPSVVGGGFGNSLGQGHSIANAPPNITVSVPFPPIVISPAKSDWRPGSRPWNAPPGTLPIDQHPETKGRVHPIKEGIKGDGVGPGSWVGVSPEGDIIVTNPDGSMENLGPHNCY